MSQEHATDASVRGSRSSSSVVLNAALPGRWRPWQRRKNHLIYIMIRVAWAALTRVPYVVVYGCSWLLAAVASVVVVGERRRALLHLSMAMPELSLPERRRIVRRMFLHLGQCAAEAVHLRRFVVGPLAPTLSSEQRRVLDDALGLGKGVVVVCGHIGNWELLGQVVAHAGYNVSVIAKPTYDPRLTRFIHRARTRFGMRVIWRGDNRSSHDMITVFKEGAMLGLLVDQDTKVQGDFVPFFGRPAYTTTAPATLALRFGAPVVVTWLHRGRHGHELHVERLDFQPRGDRAQDVLQLTAAINARLEAAIRSKPEQWVWMHRRWRRQPGDVVREH